MDIYARFALPPVIALLAVAGSLIALAVGVVVGFVRARRRDLLAAAAEASVGDKPPPLVEGRDVVLRGLVRHLEHHDVAVKVSITQEGSESESSGSWSYSWTEIDREIILAPFLLEIPGGGLVRVDPPKNVDVADALDQKVLIRRDRRVLSAELVPGELIYARGRLERSDQAVATSAYRDVGWGWALRATGGQMLLSSEPLGSGLRQRASFHRHYARIALGLFLATQLSLVWFYARAAGHTEDEIVLGSHHDQTTDSDGDTHDHYVVYLRADAIDVAAGDFGFIHDGKTLPIRVGSNDNWALGASATIGWLHGLILTATAIVFWIWYGARRRASRPWFRRKVNESGSGQLPDL